MGDQAQELQRLMGFFKLKEQRDDSKPNINAYNHHSIGQPNKKPNIYQAVVA
jgi:hypothetical protein